MIQTYSNGFERLRRATEISGIAMSVQGVSDVRNVALSLATKRRISDRASIGSRYGFVDPLISR